MNKIAEALFWAVREAEVDANNTWPTRWHFEEARAGQLYNKLIMKAGQFPGNFGKITLDEAIEAAIELAHEDNFQTETQLRMALWEHYGERAGPTN